MYQLSLTLPEFISGARYKNNLDYVYPNDMNCRGMKFCTNGSNKHIMGLSCPHARSQQPLNRFEPKFERTFLMTFGLAVLLWSSKYRKQGAIKKTQLFLSLHVSFFCLPS